MAESDRYLPTLITKLEDTLVEAGLRDSSIVMRMTGCPNGCARPWVAELACVGKAPGTYNLMLGGGYHGERLNKLYRQITPRSWSNRAGRQSAKKKFWIFSGPCLSAMR